MASHILTGFLPVLTLHAGMQAGPLRSAENTVTFTRFPEGDFSPSPASLELRGLDFRAVEIQHHEAGALDCRWIRESDLRLSLEGLEPAQVLPPSSYQGVSSRCLIRSIARNGFVPRLVCEAASPARS